MMVLPFFYGHLSNELNCCIWYFLPGDYPGDVSRHDFSLHSSINAEALFGSWKPQILDQMRIPTIETTRNGAIRIIVNNIRYMKQNRLFRKVSRRSALFRAKSML